MNEVKAIKLCLKARDAAGFEFLVERYRREAFFHAMALLRNEDDAADACQDAFSSAFVAMPGLSHLDRFYPWFFRILKNRCLNMLARRKTRERHAAEERAGAGDGTGVGAGGSGVSSVDESTPATEVVRRETVDEIMAAMSELRQSHREILTLKYIHGQRYAEIAVTIGIPRGTVMSRLYAARKAFREAYGALPGNELKYEPKPKPEPMIR